MLSHSRLVGFVATAKPAEARSFYEGVLGLALVEEGPFTLVFDANGTTVRVQIAGDLDLSRRVPRGMVQGPGRQHVVAHRAGGG